MEKDNTTIQFKTGGGSFSPPVSFDKFKDAVGKSIGHSEDDDAPQDMKYWAAPASVRDLAGDVIERDFRELLNVKIAYIMQEEHSTSKGKMVLARVEKQNEKQKIMHGQDVIITIAHDIWQKLSSVQKEACLYHELCHLLLEVDDKDNDKISILAHDLEFFRAEFRKYGAWNIDLELLVKDVKQMDLFDDQKAETEAR